MRYRDGFYLISTRISIGEGQRSTNPGFDGIFAIYPVVNSNFKQRQGNRISPLILLYTADMMKYYDNYNGFNPPEADESATIPADEG
jgi:hypothetical protein